MTDRFDAWLETGLRDLEAAVPLGQTVDGLVAGTGLVRVPRPALHSVRAIGSLVAAVVVIAILAILLPRLSSSAPGASQSTVPGASAGAGRSPAPSPSPSPTSQAEVVQYLGGLSFVTPADWHLLPSSFAILPGPVLFVGNATLADPCPTVLVVNGCIRLGPNQILATFSSVAITGLNPVRDVTASAPDAQCAEIGGERQLNVRLDSLYLTACLRGPDFDANESAFRRLVASVPPQGSSLVTKFSIPDSGITLSPPGNVFPGTTADAAYQLCLTPGGADCRPGTPTTIQLALITDTSSTLVKPGTLVWVMGWLGVTTCTPSLGPVGRNQPGNQSPVATPGQPLCDAYTFIDAQSGKFIFGYEGPHH